MHNSLELSKFGTKNDKHGGPKHHRNGDPLFLLLLFTTCCSQNEGHNDESIKAAKLYSLHKVVQKQNPVQHF